MLGAILLPLISWAANDPVFSVPVTEVNSQGKVIAPATTPVAPSKPNQPVNEFSASPVQETNGAVHYEIGGADLTGGVDCFDYYRFGRKGWTDMSIVADKRQYDAGQAVIFKGNIKNLNSLPLTNLKVVIQVARFNEADADKHDYGDFLVDEIYPLTNFSLNASSSKDFEFYWPIPKNITEGQYIIGASLMMNDQYAILGLPFIDGSYLTAAYIDIFNKQESEVIFDRTKAVINGVAYKPKRETPQFDFEKTKEYSVGYSLQNLSNASQETSITKKLFKWDNYNAQNLVSQKSEQVTIGAGKNLSISDKLGELKGGVYFYQIVSESNGIKSIFNFRFSVNQKDLVGGKIAFSSLSNYPLQKGNNAFIFNCFHSISDLYNFSGKIVSILRDSSGKEILKSEYSSENIGARIMASKKDFVVGQDYNDLTLETVLYDKDGKEMEKSVLKYNCEQFSNQLRYIGLEAVGNTIIVTPRTICQKPVSAKIDLEVRDSKDKVVFIGSKTGDRIEQKIDFKPGEKYLIGAFNGNLGNKLEYTYQSPLSSSNKFNFFNLLYLAVIVFAIWFIAKFMKNKSVQTIFFVSLLLFTAVNIYAAAPATPSLTSPASSITSVPMNGGWNSVTGATKYKWEIRAGSCSGLLITSGETTGTSISIGGDINIWSGVINNYLCVKACNNSNECSVASYRNFIANLRPTLSSPINGGNLSGYDKKLDWSDVTGVFGYQYQVCSNASCATIISSDNVTSSEIEIKDVDISSWDENTAYYWRVRSCAKSGYANCNTWASAYYFYNKLVPNYTSPANGYSVTAIPLTIKWADVTGLDHYRYQICAKSDCSDATPIWDGTTTATSSDLYMNVNIWDGANYYWRTRSCYDADEIKCSKWNKPTLRYFISNVRVTVTTSDSSQLKGFDDNLSWTAISGADKYEIVLCKTYTYGTDGSCPSASVIGTKTTDGSATSISLSQFSGQWANLNMFAWTIRACNGSNCSKWNNVSNSRMYILYPKKQVDIVSPSDGATISGFGQELSWTAISGADKYEIVLCKTYTYGTDGSCPSASVLGNITSTSTNAKLSTKENIWNKNNNPIIGWTIRACNDSNCSKWNNVSNSRMYILYVPNISVEINSLPSPPNGIDIISPPIVFDWRLVDGAPGYQFKIVKRNEPTNSALRQKIYRVGPDIGHVEINYQEDTSGFFRDALGKLTGGNQGYEWYIRFCTGENIDLCGDNNSSAWTSVRTFTLEQNLVKDSMGIFTDSTDPSLRRKGGAGATYRTITNPDRSSIDIFMGAVFTGVLSFNPYAGMYDSEDWLGVVQVGQKAKIELSIPDITYEGRDRFIRRPPPPPPPPVTSWGARGGVRSDPVIWWVKDANKVRTDMSAFPSDYLYEQTANLGALGTYKPKLGLAVTDPRQTTSTVEVEIFDKIKCSTDSNGFLVCPPTAKSNNLIVVGEKDGKWVLQANGPTTALIQVKIAGIVSTQILVSDINPAQAWYQGGTWTSELKSFDLVVEARSVEAEAGVDKKTSSDVGVQIGPGGVLGMEKFPPEANPGEPISEMVPNPAFNPAQPPNPITNPPTIMVQLATQKIERYSPKIVWKCEDENGNDVTNSVLDDPTKENPVFKTIVEKDTDYKCSFIVEFRKITEILKMEQWNPATGKVEPATPPVLVGAPTDEIVNTVSDWIMVTVTYKVPNKPPVLSDSLVTPVNPCDGLSYIISWKYSDPDDPPNPQWSYEVIFNGEAKEVLGSSNSYSISSGLEYDTTYNWSVKAWDTVESKKGDESNILEGSFTTPPHKKPVPAFNISKELKGTIPSSDPPKAYDKRSFAFTDNGSVYPGDKATFTFDFGDGATKSFEINTADADTTNDSWPEVIHAYTDSKKLHTITLTIKSGDSDSCECSVGKTLRESVPTYSEPEGIDY